MVHQPLAAQQVLQSVTPGVTPQHSGYYSQNVMNMDSPEPLWRKIARAKRICLQQDHNLSIRPKLALVEAWARCCTSQHNLGASTRKGKADLTTKHNAAVPVNCKQAHLYTYPKQHTNKHNTAPVLATAQQDVQHIMFGSLAMAMRYAQYAPRHVMHVPPPQCGYKPAQSQAESTSQHRVRLSLRISCQVHSGLTVHGMGTALLPASISKQDTHWVQWHW